MSSSPTLSPPQPPAVAASAAVAPSIPCGPMPTPHAAIAEHLAYIGDDPLRTAFVARRPLMPWSVKTPLPPAAIAEQWRRLAGAASPPSRRPRLVYVHIPFCTNHCLFCGFYRQRFDAAAGRAYTDLLLAEIERDAAAPGLGTVPIQAVYLGGGTPSALAAADLRRLLTALRRALPLAPDCEITVEGRVAGFTPEKIDACQAAGANRFSIGVQSFDTGLRRRLGRKASGAAVQRFLTDLRTRTDAALVLDLIYGLPGQAGAVWQTDLATCAALAPDGVDLYSLHLIPGTPLREAIAAGRLPAAADIGTQAALYAQGVATLAEAADQGWQQISNSHWARTPRERNRYNRLVKEGADCLAFGAGAGGAIGPYSFNLQADLDRYRTAVEQGHKPLASMHRADARQPLRDLLSGAIEAGTLDLAALATQLHPALTDWWEAAWPAAAQTPAGSGMAAGAETEAPPVPALPALGGQADAAADAALAQAMAMLLAQWTRASLLTGAGTGLHLTTAGRFWAPNLSRALNSLCSTYPASPAAAAIPTETQP
ncbi:MAG: heme anaerobic degradation radical SAM methyltransferase ChuW/HutW [Chromatiaceae bacterium]|nr:MAG: heme anaerobic degradation radical SAM methyltransferase ChuW/HutW [Chromatiaceae bacterium]